MERENLKDSASNSTSDKPAEELEQKGKPEESDAEDKPTSLGVETKVLDQPYSSASYLTDVKITSSEKKTPPKTFHGSEQTTKPMSPICGEKKAMVLNLPESELIAMSSRISETNYRYLGQLKEAEQSKQLSEDNKVREREEVAVGQQQAEARQHVQLDQKDSLLAESGEVFNLAMLRGAVGHEKSCDEEVDDQSDLSSLHRSRILLGFITHKFEILQQLRFDAEVLMQFLEERRNLFGDGRKKFKDPCNSPSIPKFSLRPIVKGLSEVMDELQPLLEKFIRSTRDIVKKYRLKSPELDANAFRDYTNQFFELRGRLGQLENLLQVRRDGFDDKAQVLKEILELQKQARTFKKLLVESYFKFEEILYQYSNCVSQNPNL